MEIVTVEQFLSCLEKSGLASAERLTAARKLAGQGGNSESLARALVKEGWLTRWQAGQLLVGRTQFILGKYRLLELLGRGGMGKVYQAEHTTMQRRVALKLVSQKMAADPAARDRFLTEARTAASLDHPNLVRAYNVDSEGDRYYMVMEYVEGQDLERIVQQQGPLDYATAADAIRQAAEGLAHAHSRNVIHCDIKPSNLLVNKQGTVKILDMGLARMTDDDAPAGGDQQVQGTVDYMAPEQAMGENTFDHRADIYALGCTFYFLLTGRPPFSEGTMAQRIVKHQVEEPPAITKTRPDAPKPLLEICRKMMAKDPAQRYATATAVSRALLEWNPDQRELKHAIPIEDDAEEDPLQQILEAAQAAPRTVVRASSSRKRPAAEKDPVGRTSARGRDKKPMISRQQWIMGGAIGFVVILVGIVITGVATVGGKSKTRTAQTEPAVKIAKPPAPKVHDTSFANLEAELKNRPPEEPAPPPTPPPAKPNDPKQPAAKNPAKPLAKPTDNTAAADKGKDKAKEPAKQGAPKSAASKPVPPPPRKEEPIVTVAKETVNPVAVPDSESLNMRDELTIVAHFRSDGPNNQYQTIVSKTIQTKDKSDHRNFSLSVHRDTGELSFGARFEADKTGKPRYFPFGVKVHDKTWRCVGVTYSKRDGKVILYVDGKPVKNYTENRDLEPNTAKVVVATSLIVAKDDKPYPNGAVRNVRIWNRTLSAEEVAAESEK